VFIARWNLKEAAGKILARRTEITYEAVPFGREGNHLQSPIVIREGGAVDVAGVWEEGRAHYPMTFHRKPRLKVAPASVKRHKVKIKEILRRGRGRNLTKVIEELKPVMRGWINDYQHAEVKGVFEDLDQWIRRYGWVSVPNNAKPNT